MFVHVNDIINMLIISVHNILLKCKHGLPLIALHVQTIDKAKLRFYDINIDFIFSLCIVVAIMIVLILCEEKLMTVKAPEWR